MKTARRAAALLSLGSLPALLAAAPPPPPAPPGSIPVAGPPTGVVSTDGGERVLVGFEGKFALNGGIALYRRSGTAFAPVASARTASAVQGLALSPDGRTVVATTRLGLAALDASALTAGTAKVLETRLGPAADANQIVWSRDGEHVFFTVQRYAELDVARVTPANPGGVPSVEVTGKIPLDRLPGGIAEAPDGKTLYVTSEIDTADAKTVPGASDPRLGRAKCDANLAPNGVLSAVDVRKASADPAHAVVARIAAGCAPTRVALSPDGTVAWVSVRGENRVVALDTAKMRDDAAHALLASVAVGDVPVGLAVAVDGRTLLVANSHRSRDADDARAADLSVVDVEAALHGGKAVISTVPTGALAREVVATPDGGFLVTNALSRAIAVVTPAQLRPLRSR